MPLIPLGCNYFITITLQGYLITIMENFFLSFLNPSLLKLNTYLTYFTQSPVFPLTCSTGLCSFLKDKESLSRRRLIFFFFCPHFMAYPTQRKLLGGSIVNADRLDLNRDYSVLDLGRILILSFK